MTETTQQQPPAIPISSARMVRFIANIPIEIALQCTDGIRVEGRYGDRMKYTLTDDRTMYVDPFVADRIKDLDVQPGEVFQICKCQAKKGNRRTIYWLVQRSEELASQLERDLLKSLDKVRAEGIASPSANIPAPSPPTAPLPTEHPALPLYELHASVGNGKPNGHPGSNGSGKNPASPARPFAEESAITLPDTQLAHALKTAIKAAADAETFAKTLDYSVRFTTDDIRSMGITVLIGMQQQRVSR
jgi:hypothetical protein